MALIDTIIRAVKDYDASDVHLTTGSPPVLSVRGSDVEALARQVSQATSEKSTREALIRTRALIYAEDERPTHVRFMSSPDGTTKLSHMIRKESAASPKD